MPFCSRASLRRETTAEKVGVAAEVPPTEVGLPFMMTWKPSPSAATSGVARPLELNLKPKEGGICV